MAREPEEWDPRLLYRSRGKFETMAEELQSTVVDNNSFPEFCINNVTGKVHNFAYGSNISEVSSFVSKMPAHP
jgi:hypothetical protein